MYMPGSLVQSVACLSKLARHCPFSGSTSNSTYERTLNIRWTILIRQGYV